MNIEQEQHRVAIESSCYRYDYVSLQPEEQIGLHSHTEWELDYIIKGGGKRTVGGETKQFVAGELVLVPPCVPHCWNFERAKANGKRGVENITISFSDTWLSTVANTFPEAIEPIERLRNHTTAVAFDNQTNHDVAQIMLNMRTENALERLASLLRIIALLSSSSNFENIGYGRPATIDEQLLDAVRVYVACNFNRKISLDDVARHVGKSKANFCRWYKMHAGTTFFSYLNSFRVDRACHLLTAYDDMSIGEVAMKCGFDDVPYFFRVFHSVTGSTPRAYRQQH